MSPREEQQLFHQPSTVSLESAVAEPKPQTPPPHEATKVRFAFVQIRTYNRMVGDHPDVHVGPPLTLDWDYEQNDDVLLEDYENNRKPKKRVLRLSSITRKNILRNVFDVDDNEILGAEKEIQKIRKQRERTNKQSKTGAKVENAFQSARRKIFGRVNRDMFLKGLSAASGSALWIQA